jgi:flagellar biogenesis protein FliO
MLLAEVALGGTLVTVLVVLAIVCCIAWLVKR